MSMAVGAPVSRHSRRPFATCAASFVALILLPAACAQSPTPSPIPPFPTPEHPRISDSGVWHVLEGGFGEVNALVMVSPDEGIAVGNGVMRYDGKRWSVDELYEYVTFKDVVYDLFGGWALGNGVRALGDKGPGRDIVFKMEDRPLNPFDVFDWDYLNVEGLAFHDRGAWVVGSHGSEPVIKCVGQCYTRSDSTIQSGRIEGLDQLKGSRLVDVDSDVAGAVMAVSDRGELLRLATEWPSRPASIDWRVHALPSKDLSGEIHALEVVDEDTVWLAGDQGIIRYEQGEYVAQTLTDELGAKKQFRDYGAVWNIKVSEDGTGWAVGSRQTLFHYDGATWHLVATLGEGVLRALSLVPRADWMVAAGPGGRFFKLTRDGSYEAMPPLPGEELSAIAQDPRSRTVWVAGNVGGTEGDSLPRQASIRAYVAGTVARSDAFPDAQITDLAVGADGVVLAVGASANATQAASRDKTSQDWKAMLWRFDGEHWRETVGPMARVFRHVATDGVSTWVTSSGPKDGSDELYAYNGDRFTPVQGLEAASIDALAATSFGLVVATSRCKDESCAAGLRRLEDRGWTELACPPGERMTALSVDEGELAWVVSQGMLGWSLLRRDQERWVGNLQHNSDDGSGGIAQALSVNRHINDEVVHWLTLGRAVLRSEDRAWETDLALDPPGGHPVPWSFQPGLLASDGENLYVVGSGGTLLMRTGIYETRAR